MASNSAKGPPEIVAAEKEDNSSMSSEPESPHEKKDGKKFEDLSIYYNSKGDLDLSGLDDWNFSDSDEYSVNSGGTLYNVPGSSSGTSRAPADLKSLILNDPTLQNLIRKGPELDKKSLQSKQTADKAKKHEFSVKITPEKDSKKNSPKTKSPKVKSEAKTPQKGPVNSPQALQKTKVSNDPKLTSLALNSSTQFILEDNSLFKKLLVGNSRVNRQLFAGSQVDPIELDLGDFAKLNIIEEEPEPTTSGPGSSSHVPTMTNCEPLSPIKGDPCRSEINPNLMLTPGAPANIKTLELGDLDTLWRDIHDTKAKMEEDIKMSEANLQILSNTSCADSNLERQLDLIRAEGGSVPVLVLKENSPSTSTMNNNSARDFEHMDLNDLLSEANILPSEFDEILSQIDFSLPPGLSGGGDFDLTPTLTHPWTRGPESNKAKEYYEKYQTEKAKHSKAKEEVITLQKANLELKEQLSNQENALNKKDTTILKVTRAFEEISKQWRVNDITSKHVAIGLQKEIGVQMGKVKKCEERISEYEKEMSSAMELANSFKTEVEKLKGDKGDLEEKLVKVKEDSEEKYAQKCMEIEELKRERDTTLRALSQAQEELDKSGTEFSLLRATLADSERTISELRELNSKQRDEIIGLEACNKSLKFDLGNYKESHKEEFNERLKAEAKKLNNYFNDKLCEILQNHSESMAEAQRTFEEDQRVKLEEVEGEWERKLVKEQKRGQTEAKELKERFEKQIENLARENELKNLLISRISDQLKLFEVKDCPNAFPQWSKPPQGPSTSTSSYAQMLLQLHDLSTEEPSPSSSGPRTLQFEKSEQTPETSLSSHTSTNVPTSDPSQSSDQEPKRPLKTLSDLLRDTEASQAPHRSTEGLDKCLNAIVKSYNEQLEEQEGRKQGNKPSKGSKGDNSTSNSTGSSSNTRKNKKHK